MAGLLAARKCGIAPGGIAPKGFKTELGPEPSLAFFGLVESGDYKHRTLQNVINSDCTIIFCVDQYSPGSYLTWGFCIDRKPYLLCNPFFDKAETDVRNFIGDVMK